MTDRDDELKLQMQEALESGDIVLESCRRLLDVISPAVDAICNQVEITTPNRSLIYRCIIKRTQENLAMIIACAESDHPYMSTMPLRPLCEDLIYGSWLRTLSAEDGDEFVELSMMSDLLKSISAQNRFLPKAYAQFAMLADEDPPNEGRPDAKQTLRPAVEPNEMGRLRYKQDLKKLGLKLGWQRGKQPSIYDMAKQCGLSEIYDFLYHGSSKAVHASLHNMARMVWGDPDGSFTISSHNFERYYVRFALSYSVWLVEEILSRIAQPEFPEEFKLIDDVAYAIWLALVLTGLARNKALPPLVTKEELRWRPRKTDEQPRWPDRGAVSPGHEG